MLINPCGEGDQLIVCFNFTEKWLSEAKKKCVAKRRVKNLRKASILDFFFALLSYFLA